MEGKIPGAASNQYANSLQTSGRRRLQTVLLRAKENYHCIPNAQPKKRKPQYDIDRKKIQTI